jgi:malonate transporter and related proteins
LLGVVSTTGVVFVLIALGYFSVVRGIFSQDDLRVFGRYIVNFALPALVFRAVTGPDLAEVLDAGYAAAYATGSLVAFATGYVVSTKLLRLPPISATFQGMGMSCSNSGFVGYPLLLMTMPPIASTVLALNMTIENLLMIPLVLIIAERASGEGVHGWPLVWRIFSRLLFRNPVVLALVIGLVVAFLEVDLPQIIAQPIEIVASSSTAISLMVIGGTLVGLSVRTIRAPVILVVAGKLVFFPCMVWLALWLYGMAGLQPVNPDLARAAIINAAMPAAGIYPIFAQRYGQQENAALALLLMVLLSFFTLSLTMAMLGMAVAG